MTISLDFTTYLAIICTAGVLGWLTSALGKSSGGGPGEAVIGLIQVGVAVILVLLIWLTTFAVWHFA